MKNGWVITIGRKFCSGGAEIARKIAQNLEIPYYDKEIIDRTAGLLNISSDVVKEHDEKPAPFWNISGYQYNTLWYAEDPSLLLPLSYRIADAQFHVIREAANTGPCVIVGRAADYTLKNRTNVLSVFIYADLEVRIERAVRLYQITASEAKKLILHTDRIRRNYYENYTQQKWGAVENYHLMIDSGKLGTDAASSLIAYYAKNFLPTNSNE